MIGTKSIMDDYKPTPAHIHRQRGRCCKSLCLHCPFEYTTEHLKFEFQQVDSTCLDDAKQILQKSQPQGIASLMLMQATGEKSVRIDDQNMSSFYIFSLKGFTCGLFRLEADKPSIYLLEDFNDQGIDKLMVQDHFQRQSKNENQV